ncbi:hypothetical protein HOP50_01g03810 [Chloropicon primus]|uniref:Nucleolar protein 11 n=2 Tax=Chloropicon primus TaxID=1764295 RepID=A0A5B8ME04_9CHLO|nr:hypothetical protein A3770_01p03930 [Chloropicon primus]UPQ97090.1 hypothetical protein HOP50_01g03810 [Chloropicon primus]|eukprot:QDZ17875.1 hypothetical protein A3770_01p03930 [Chloropicon primus]
MSRVEGDFVFGRHVDVVGVSCGPSETALVTLHKGGVIQHSLTTQEQVQSWTLGGSASRKIVSNATYVRSKQDVVHFAAIVQERKRNYLWLWDQTNSSVNEGTKHSLNSSEKATVFAVDGVKKTPEFFLIATYDGKLAKLEPGSDLSWFQQGSSVPEGAKVLDIQLSYVENVPCLCYLYKQGGDRKVKVCRVVTSGKSSSAEAAFTHGGIGDVPELGAFKEGKTCVVNADGVLTILQGQGTGKEVAGEALCTIKELAGTACVFLTPTQVGIVGLSRAKGESDRISLTVVDAEYKLVLHQYFTSDDNSLAKGEYLIGVQVLNEDTILVATNKKQFCFKVTLGEMNFSTVLGALKKKESQKSRFVDFGSVEETAQPRLTTVPADSMFISPPQRNSYDICERLEPKNFDFADHTDEVASLKDRFGTRDLSNSKAFLQKLGQLLKTDGGLFSEGFIASLWEECLRLSCWEGVELLLSRGMVNGGSHVCLILKKLLQMSQYKYFDAVLRVPSTISEKDLYDILVAVLTCDMGDAGVQSCLISLCVCGSGRFSKESVTSAVKRLSIKEVIALIKTFHSNLKDEITKDEEKDNKLVGGIVVFVSSIIDAHLTSLLLSKESHDVVEKLHELVGVQIQYEKTMAKLATYIKHLQSVEPLQEHTASHSKDFAVEILNINV